MLLFPSWCNRGEREITGSAINTPEFLCADVNL